MQEISDFLKYLELEKRYSVHTIKSYKNDLSGFYNFLTQQFHMHNTLEAEFKHIRYWINFLAENNISNRSINRKISCLKAFFKYNQQIGVINQNPIQNITGPKTEKNLPTFVEEKPINLLLDQYPFQNNFTDSRNKLILEFFYSTGIRLSELVNIKLNDIDSGALQIKVLGKRNKERIIPITRELQNSIGNYIKHRSAVNVSGHNFLFITEKGKPVYNKLVYRIVNNHLAYVTTKEKKSPHVLRHSFATHMLNNGADLNSIKELLGHANLAATQVYTHNSFEQLKKIYKQAHPRA